MAFVADCGVSTVLGAPCVARTSRFLATRCLAAAVLPSGRPCSAGVPPAGAAGTAAPGVWHFSAVVLAGRNHGEVLIDDMLESRLERQLGFLVVRSGGGQ
jgi:hypothetical protein